MVSFFSDLLILLLSKMEKQFCKDLLTSVLDHDSIQIWSDDGILWFMYRFILQDQQSRCTKYICGTLEISSISMFHIKHAFIDFAEPHKMKMDRPQPSTQP